MASNQFQRSQNFRSCHAQPARHHCARAPSAISAKNAHGKHQINNFGIAGLQIRRRRVSEARRTRGAVPARQAVRGHDFIAVFPDEVVDVSVPRGQRRMRGAKVFGDGVVFDYSMLEAKNIDFVADCLVCGLPFALALAAFVRSRFAGSRRLACGPELVFGFIFALSVRHDAYDWSAAIEGTMADGSTYLLSVCTKQARNTWLLTF